MSKTNNNLKNHYDRASDFLLIDSALSGDQSAYEVLFKKYQGKILKFFMKKVMGNVADSEDMVQDTFTLAFSKLHTFKKKSCFYTWLCRIAINVFLTFCRRNKRHFISIDEFFGQQTVNGEQIGKNTQGDRKSYIGKSDQILENVPNKILVDQLMRNLPVGYKKNLELHDLQEFEFKEIAAKLQCSLVNAKSQHYRAIEKIRMAEGIIHA
ncbi:MAG: RNA polymerase sigma factor [Candidatus Yanofskybacteria bacterium]|nr:RNA polymerase sigma factor [Candidatus Yanofskybacteria bacterium]